MNRILIVCVANICRSPIGEGLFKKIVKNNSLDVSIKSAGIHALIGHPAYSKSQEISKQYGIDISSHKAQPLSSELLRSSDLILVMDEWQKETVKGLNSSTWGKTYLIGHWLNCEIEDPYRKEIVYFEQTFLKLNDSVNTWSQKLWSRSQKLRSKSQKLRSGSKTFG